MYHLEYHPGASLVNTSHRAEPKDLNHPMATPNEGTHYEIHRWILANAPWRDASLCRAGTRSDCGGRCNHHLCPGREITGARAYDQPATVDPALFLSDGKSDPCAVCPPQRKNAAQA